MFLTTVVFKLEKIITKRWTTFSGIYEVITPKDEVQTQVRLAAGGGVITASLECVYLD